MDEPQTPPPQDSKNKKGKREPMAIYRPPGITSRKTIYTIWGKEVIRVDGFCAITYAHQTIDL
jgi:hypothetical protein